MVLLIDIDKAKQANITLNELMTLYKLDNLELDYLVYESDIESLQKKKYIKFKNTDNGKGIIFRQKGLDLLESMKDNKDLIVETLTKKVSKRTINQVINYRLKDFRHKFKGLKPGAMGSAKACKEKMERWIKENPEYSFDDILKATDLYINSLNGDYRFLQRADYFIFKKEGKEESSRLSAFIEEVDMDIIDVDWTSNLN